MKKSILNLKLNINGRRVSPAAAGVEIPEKNLIFFEFDWFSWEEILNLANLDVEQIA